MMKSTVETITPQKAQDLLNRHWVKEHQRTPSPFVVDDYAREMRAGRWGLSHQGIAIADNNELVDGMHRLLAIVKAGVPVALMVTRGVPAVASNEMRTFDLIDRGKSRSIGTQLVLHGLRNGSQYAAAARAILLVICRAHGVPPGRQNTGTTLAVIKAYASELAAVMSEPTPKGVRGLASGAVVGSFALAMHAQRAPVLDALHAFLSGEELRKGHPMLTLRNHMLASRSMYGGDNGGVVANTRAILNALHKHVSGEPMTRANITSDAGTRFFLDQQRRDATALLVVCGHIATPVRA